MTVDRTTVLVVLPEHGFEDEEVNGLTRVFETRNYDMTFVTVSGEDARGKEGLFIDVDAALEDVDVGEFGIVVFVGCSGSEDELTDQRVREAFVRAREGAVAVGSVCMATAVLASFGLLEEDQVAVPTERQIAVEERVREVVPGSCARSENLFTCAGGDVVEEMAEKIVEYIIHRSEHDEITQS